MLFFRQTTLFQIVTVDLVNTCKWEIVRNANKNGGSDFVMDGILTRSQEGVVGVVILGSILFSFVLLSHITIDKNKGN